MISQIFIAILGLSAIYLTQQKNENLKKYAPILGLASQPFWIYTTYITDQWGMFILSIMYSYAWVVGVKNYWFQKD